MSAYDDKTPAEVVDDYVLVRGDLSDPAARAQLASWIENYVRERGDSWRRALAKTLDRAIEAEDRLRKIEALATQWEADDEDHLDRFGQHLMGGSVLSCAEHLQGVLSGEADRR